MLLSAYYGQQGEKSLRMSEINVFNCFFFVFFVDAEVVLSFWDLEVKETVCWLTMHREIQLKAPLVRYVKNLNRLEFPLSLWSQAAFLLNHYLNRQFRSVSKAI